MSTASVIPLHYTAPSAFEQTLAFMRPRAMSGVEIVTNDTYHRTFANADGRGFFSVINRPDQSTLKLTIEGDCSKQQQGNPP